MRRRGGVAAAWTAAGLLVLGACADQTRSPAPAAAEARPSGGDAEPDREPLSAAALAAVAPADPLTGAGFALPDYEEAELANGVRLILAPRREVPLVAFRATVAGGVVAEPPGRNGAAAVTAALLEQGAGNRDGQAFAEAVAAVGGMFEVEPALEALVISGEFMARDSARMVELLADVLLRPTLAKDDFDKVRARAIQSVAALRDSDPGELIQTYARAFVHGDHPYGRPLTGSEESLGRLRHDDVLAFHRDQFGADRTTLTVVGDFDRDEMRERLAAALGGWRGAAQAPSAVPATAAGPGERVLLVDKPGIAQTYFWIGNVGAARGDPETPAIDLVNTLFGGRFTSRLNNALRVESGLTYGAYSVLERHRQAGTLGMLSFCAVDKTAAAIDLALRQLDGLHAPGLDAAEIASGRNYILGTYTLSLETGPQLAAALGGLKFYGLPDDSLNAYASRVASVSRAQTAHVIRRVFPARDELVYVVMGDAALIREQLAAYGEISELPLSAPRFRP